MKLTKVKIASAGALLLAGLTTSLVLQHRANSKLADAQAQLREATAQLQTLRAQNERLLATQADPAELARLRQNQSELLKLRGELALLRKNPPASTTAKTNPPTASPAASEPASPVVTFTAALSARIPPGQTLVTGGWKTAEGKRTMLLITPNALSSQTPDNRRGIDIQSVFVQIPDQLLSSVGWDQFKADSNESKQQALLTRAQFNELLNLLKQSEGVQVLSLPRLLTHDGHQAQVKTINPTPTGTGEYLEIGPVIDLVASIAPDGATDLNIAARINQLQSP